MTAPGPDAALDDALAALFAARFDDFVDERKRLVGELRKAGHRAQATALSKVNRPSLSCWTINQLVRRDVSELDALFSAAHRIRLGDFSATADHRALLARLHTRALEVLREAELPTSDATMRRIATTLAALSAAGGFAPDVPGRMLEDRDPPGFDAMDLAVSGAPTSYLSVVPRRPSSPSISVPPSSVPPPAPAAAPATTLPAAPSPTLPAAPSPAPAATPPSTATRLAAPEPATPSARSLKRSTPSARTPEPATPNAPPSAEAAAPRAKPTLTLVPDETSRDDGSPTAAAPPVDEAALAELAAAEALAAEAAARLAAAQAAAREAAARVQRARQQSLLESLRAKQKRLASAIHDHEQAILVLQRDLDQRRTLLTAARAEVAPLAAQLAELEAALGETAPADDASPTDAPASS